MTLWPFDYHLMLTRRGALSRRMRKRRIPAHVWFRVEKGDPLLARFNSRERPRLRMLASEILWRTHFYAAPGMVLTDTMKAFLATRIALVIYGLADPEKKRLAALASKLAGTCSLSRGNPAPPPVGHSPGGQPDGPGIA